MEDSKKHLDHDVPNSVQVWSITWLCGHLAVNARGGGSSRRCSQSWLLHGLGWGVWSKFRWYHRNCEWPLAIMISPQLQALFPQTSSVCSSNPELPEVRAMFYGIAANHIPPWKSSFHMDQWTAQLNSQAFWLHRIRAANISNSVEHVQQTALTNPLTHDKHVHFVGHFICFVWKVQPLNQSSPVMPQRGAVIGKNIVFLSNV